LQFTSEKNMAMNIDIVLREIERRVGLELEDKYA
jgi:hypothetical protein